MAIKENNQLGTKVIDISEMLKTIPIACAWCGKIYHIKQWQIAEGHRSGISHGICPTCAEKQKEELENLLAKTQKK